MSAKVALVAGGSRGIGAATSRLLAGRGLRVVVNYRSSTAEAEKLVASIRETGGEAIAVRADVRDPGEVRALVSTTTDQWGRVDVLVNTALIPYPIKLVAEMTWEEFGGKLNDEMRAAFLLTQEVRPGMVERRYGRIVHVATNLARHPRAGMAALGASKAALVAFAQYTAQELGPHGITVNVVSPGTVDTRIVAERLPDDVRNRIVAATPMGRIAQPEDVAEMIAYFACAESDFMTGTYAPVNGGFDMD